MTLLSGNIDRHVCICVRLHVCVCVCVLVISVAKLVISSSYPLAPRHTHTHAHTRRHTQTSRCQADCPSGRDHYDQRQSWPTAPGGRNGDTGWQYIQIKERETKAEGEMKRKQRNGWWEGGMPGLDDWRGEEERRKVEMGIWRRDREEEEREMGLLFFWLFLLTELASALDVVI